MNRNIDITKQKDFFDFIKKHHEGNEKLSKILMTIIDSSLTTVYKKMRGEVLLNLEELIKIKEYFNISLDQFYYTKYSPISFQYDSLRTTPSSPLDFLKNVSKHMVQVTKAKSVHYTYVCNEVPLYHILQFPLLTSFKMYVWNELSWRIKDTTEREFSKDLYTNIPEWDIVVKKMLAIYFDSPGIEIWNPLFFDATIEQIKYLYMTGDIPKVSIAHSILEELEALRILLMDFTKKGVKYIKNDPEKSSAKGVFYYTSLHTGSELVLVRSDNRSAIFTGFDTPNSMVSLDPRMNQYSKNHIDNILRYSTNITKSNKIQRNLFFNSLKKKISFAKQELDQYSRIAD